MKFKAICALCATMLTLPCSLTTNAATEKNPPSGWLLWHSYSDYSAMDSTLYLRNPQGETTEISGNFVHAMNGDFGSSPTDITFMAIDQSADEWDIYRYNSISGKITNLTEKSGFRNEDPKFSPDGQKIVFKRGFWDNSHNDFTYNLAEIDLNSGEITMLTDDTKEQSMPYYSDDGKYIYYSECVNRISSIWRMNVATKEKVEIFAEKGVNAYYPVAKGDKVYFAKWHSADNRNDMITSYNADGFTDMPFNSADFNCSDPCPVTDSTMIYSCTKNNSYDLFYFDSTESYALDTVNSTKNELGATFYSDSDIKKYASDLQKHILGYKSANLNFDVDGDGIVNTFDMIYTRKLLNKLLTDKA